MPDKTKAAALAGAHGLDETGSTDVIEYCPPERKLRQRDRLLTYLRTHGSITTAEARTKLGMMSPASRIMELRRAGHVITREHDGQQGCARYILRTGNADQGGERHA